MIVCSCNVLSDGQIRACVNPGPGCPRTAADVYQCLGCSPKCGRCARTIRAIVANALHGAAEHLASCATECAAACPLGKAVQHVHEQERFEHERIGLLAMDAMATAIQADHRQADQAPAGSGDEAANDRVATAA